VRRRWKGDGGYCEVLNIAVPMILSMGSWSLMHFVDRVFLTWYSRDALAAALPSGILSFTLGTFFLGTAGYVNTFVAQYMGANRPERVGASVWQGIHFSILAGLFLLVGIPFAPWIFDAAGHEPSIRALEVVYFQILMVGWLPGLIMPAVSSFYSGRGVTRPVMWVNLVAATTNIGLDYILIFGKLGLPEMGIEGAAWATVLAHCFGAIVFLLMFFGKKNRETYNTLVAWRFDRDLFLRMMKFGAPNGIQFFVELMGFSLFILLVGRLGTVELAATNVAFNVNTLAFLPLVGLGISVSTLVGRYLGQDAPHIAERSTWSGIHISLVYMGTMAFLYSFTPMLFLAPFLTDGNAAEVLPIVALATILLKFVAVYSVFDGVYIVFSAAVKGAGDTRFVMWVTMAVSVGVMVIPVWAGITWFGLGLYAAWIFASTYIIILSVVFYFRFRGGKWKSMRVIEGSMPKAESDPLMESDVQTI
jgi:MATE family multidrug resistance protein